MFDASDRNWLHTTMFDVDRASTVRLANVKPFAGLELVTDPWMPRDMLLQIPSHPHQVFMHPSALEDVKVTLAAQTYQQRTTALAVLRHERRRHALGRRTTAPTAEEALRRAGT